MNKENQLDSFKCQQCGNCCRGRGSVRLRDKDVAAIAAYLSVTTHEFTSQYTSLTSDRRCLILIDGKNKSCVFLDEFSRCMIDKVKPEQCRAFPFKWSYPGWQDECKAFAVNSKK